MTLEQNFLPFLFKYLQQYQHITMIAKDDLAAKLLEWGVIPGENEVYDLSKLNKQ